MVADTAVTPKTVYVSEPGLLDLMADLWYGKFFIIIGAVLGVIAALIFFSMAQPQYRAEMLVGPAERGTGPDIKALLPENSSFAVQYLVNSLGSQDSNDYIRFEYMLRGVTVASQLVDDQIVKDGVARAGLFGAEGLPEDFNADSLARFLDKHVSVQPVGTSPLRRVVFSHPDKEFALYLLQLLYDKTDGVIQQDVRSKTATRAEYLQNAIQETQHPDHKRALTSLLMEQEHISMILDMDEPFAALVVEPSSVADKPAWPRKAIFWPAFILVGCFLGFFVYQLRKAVKQSAS
ncbi:MAG TPA: chain length determinant family protein [Micavibrio sp.]|nr:chain length determinant family protein [Micavibrio sp.]HIL29712.1 chain length determinant family protein [Micavibrio sp.]